MVVSTHIHFCTANLSFTFAKRKQNLLIRLAEVYNSVRSSYMKLMPCMFLKCLSSWNGMDSSMEWLIGKVNRRHWMSPGPELVRMRSEIVGSRCGHPNRREVMTRLS